MKSIYPFFTYAGAIPFTIGAAFLVFGVETFPIIGDTKQAFSIYALMIATFMAGIHWGQDLQLRDQTGVYLPVVSNVIVVSLWFAFLILPFKTLLFTFVTAFTVILVVDRKLFRLEYISAPYFRMRCYMTAVVIGTLVLTGMYA